jgi:hypothetical protein
LPLVIVATAAVWVDTGNGGSRASRERRLTIEPGAGLNAVTHANVSVWRNLIVEPGGGLGLGCSPRDRLLVHDS